MKIKFGPFNNKFVKPGDWFYYHVGYDGNKADFLKEYKTRQFRKLTAPLAKFDNYYDNRQFNITDSFNYNEIKSLGKINPIGTWQEYDILTAVLVFNNEDYDEMGLDFL